MTTQPSPEIVCRRCYLAQPTKHKFCARCGTALALQRESTEVIAANVAAKPPILQAGRFSNRSASLFGGVTLILICLELFAVSPGLGIAAAVLALPALIRTVLVVRLRQAKGKPINDGQKFGLFLASLGTTYIITFVTFLATAGVFIGASITLLFATCLVAVTNPRGPNPDMEKLMMIVGVICLVVAAAVLLGFSFWVRDRWRRDVQ